jgi:hypothetical protein
MLRGGLSAGARDTVALKNSGARRRSVKASEFAPISAAAMTRR